MKNVSRHFLGKKAPLSKTLEPARPLKKPSYIAALTFVLAPLFFGTALLTFTGAIHQPASLSRNASTACKDAAGSINDTQIFPLIPDSLVAYNATDGCVPALWDRYVAKVLVEKALALLNYVAGALAVLATIFAGVMYLTSYASEANAKKAKAVLVGTYIGFFITLGARMIVNDSFYLFGDSNAASLNCVISNGC